MLQKKNNHKISDPLFDTNEKLYDRFEWHKINKSNIIIIPNITKNNVDSKNALRKESKKSHSFRMHKKSHNLDENLFTRASTENNEPIISYQDLQKGKSFLKDDDSNLDLLSQDSSFLYNENPFFSGNLRNKNQILSQDLNIKYFKQNPIDFRPRLLTTGKCFFSLYFKKIICLFGFLRFQKI